MAALTAEKDVPELASGFSQRMEDFGSGTFAASAVFKGALMVYDPSAQTIEPGGVDTDLIALGRAEESATTAEIAAGKKPKIRSGIFAFENSTAGDAIANTDAGATCYIVDDQTVAKTNGTNTRSAAGKIVKVSGGKVYVAVGAY